MSLSSAQAITLVKELLGEETINELFYKACLSGDRFSPIISTTLPGLPFPIRSKGFQLACSKGNTSSVEIFRGATQEERTQMVRETAEKLEESWAEFFCENFLLEYLGTLDEPEKVREILKKVGKIQGRKYVDNLASSGKVSIIRVLVEEYGLRWTCVALDRATGGGNLAVLRYLVERGGNPSPVAWIFAMKLEKGSEPILDYLREIECPVAEQLVRKHMEENPFAASRYAKYFPAIGGLEQLIRGSINGALNQFKESRRSKGERSFEDYIKSLPEAEDSDDEHKKDGEWWYE